MKQLQKALLLPLLTLFHPPLYADFEAAEASYRGGNHTIAFKQYHEAVENRDIRAYGKLAALYLYGVGVEKNYSLAYVWFGLAADTGDKEADRFQKAAASAMTREEIKQSDLALEEERHRLAAKPDVTIQPGL
ncbi:MAG: hypothetical protein ABW185_12465 [Sedimenticola sp.]